MTPQRKFDWSVKASPISCTALNRQCLLSVWKPSGTFEFKSSELNSGGNQPALEPMQCDLVIRRWSRRICRLEIDFQRFQIGTGSRPTSNCSTNYLEIGGKNLCGRMTGLKSMKSDKNFKKRQESLMIFILSTVTLDFPLTEETIRFPLTYQDEVDLVINIQQTRCRRR